MAGKTINELAERTALNGNENIPYQEGNSNGRINPNTLKNI